jgi:2-polyprenyl-3-methyl-5-hydroxy-6-metoxy-1,4-benzoquinol methylase
MILKSLQFLGRVVNRALGCCGLKLVRAPRLEDLDPAARSIARGLSTSQHNSQENMDAFYADPSLLETYFTSERLCFYKEVVSRVEALGLSPASVLDVGCGSGHLLAHLHKTWPGACLLGVDFSSKSVDLAQRLQPALEFRQCSIFELDRLGRTFDLVICTEVLEHLEEAGMAMEQLVSVCRPDGCVVITVPEGRGDTFAGHFNFWTPESFRREFRRWRPEVSVFGNYLFAVMRSGAVPACQ